MPALTKSLETFEKPGLVVAYPISNVKIHKGALVGANASGHAVPMSHSASLRFLGVANETVDNASGTAGSRTVLVTKAGTFAYAPAAGFTPAQGDVGKELYAVSDWEVQAATAGLTNQNKVGTMVGLETTSTGASGLRLRIDNHTV